MWIKTFALACLVTACQGSQNPSSLASEEAALETIYGYTLKSKSIDFVVRSTGCTSAQNFMLVETKSIPAQWILRRTKPDYCKAAPFLTVVTLSKAAVEGEIQNPIQVQTPAVSCSTPVVKPLPGTADMMYLDASIEVRYDAQLCEGKGGYTLTGSASRTGGFAGFSDFEMIQSEVCVTEGQLQSTRIKTQESEAQLLITKVGAEGIEKLTLSVDAGRLSGSQYRMTCQK